jgi:hypothetical protein
MPPRKCRILLVFAATLLVATIEAKAINCVSRDLTVTVAGHRFGFQDWSMFSYETLGPTGGRLYTKLYVGPLGSLETPFSAVVGLVLTALAFHVMVTSAILVARWTGSKSQPPPT